MPDLHRRAGSEGGSGNGFDAGGVPFGQALHNRGGCTHETHEYIAVPPCLSHDHDDRRRCRRPGLTARPAFAGTLDDIRQKGVLTVGTGVMGSKPWIWKNQDGTLAGMDYDMIQYIVEAGVSKAEFVAVEWETLIPGLKSKRWDIIFSGMTVTEERRQGAGIEFSRPYYFESNRIVVKSDSPYLKPEDLAGKILAVPIGTVEEIQGKALVAKGIGGEVKAFNDNARLLPGAAERAGGRGHHGRPHDRGPDGGDAQYAHHRRRVQPRRRSQMAGGSGQGALQIRRRRGWHPQGELTCWRR